MCHNLIINFWLFFSADIISCVEFNQDGDLLATGDKGGRVVIFQRDPAVSTLLFVYHDPRLHSLLKVSKNRNDFKKTSFLPKPTKLLSEFLPYDKVGRNPDNNLVDFWEKRCLHKIISVFTDLYQRQRHFIFVSNDLSTFYIFKFGKKNWYYFTAFHS